MCVFGRGILKQDPETALKNGHPGPEVELEFWDAKADNLNSLHTQLSGEKIRKVIKVLEVTKSTYFPAFNRLCKEVCRPFMSSMCALCLQCVPCMCALYVCLLSMCMLFFVRAPCMCALCVCLVYVHAFNRLCKEVCRACMSSICLVCVPCTCALYVCLLSVFTPSTAVAFCVSLRVCPVCI